MPGGFLSNIKFSVDKQRAEGDNIDKKRETVEAAPERAIYWKWISEPKQEEIDAWRGGTGFLLKIDIEEVKGTGRDAEFADHTLAFIEMEFPVWGGHGQGAGKANGHAIAAIDAFLLLESDSFFKRFHFDVMAGEVGDSFLQVGGGALEFKQETPPFARADLCLPDVDADVVIPDEVVTQGFIAAIGGEIEYKPFLDHGCSSVSVSFRERREAWAGNISTGRVISKVPARSCCRRRSASWRALARLATGAVLTFLPSTVM